MSTSSLPEIRARLYGDLISSLRAAYLYRDDGRYTDYVNELKHAANLAESWKALNGV